MSEQADTIAQPEGLQSQQALAQYNGAMAIVRKHALYASGAGILSTPLLYSAATSAVQLKMIKDLTTFYNVPFSNDLGKSVLASLASAVALKPFANSFVGIAKFIPVVGPVLGGIAVPASAAGLTYSIGEVFILHFQSGGTLLNFDPENFKDFFRKLFRRRTNPQAGPVQPITPAVATG